MARLRTYDGVDEDGPDMAEGMTDSEGFDGGGEEFPPYTGPSRETQDYIRSFMTPENEIAARDRVTPRGLARVDVDERPNQQGPQPRPLQPAGPGGYGRNPRFDTAPDQPNEPSPAEDSITSSSPGGEGGQSFEPFEPLPSPMSNPVVLRQLTTPAMMPGGHGLFGSSGGLQGGGLGLGTADISGASDPTALLEMILSQLQG